MKLLLFKICLLLAFASNAQTKVIFNKKLTTKKINKVFLDIENIPLQIKESLDEDIHVDFTMKFDNYTKKEIDSVIKQISFRSNEKEKSLFIDVKSRDKISKTQYSASISFTIEFAKGWESEENKSKRIFPKKKSVEEIINNIHSKRLTPLDEKEINKIFVQDKSAQKQESFFVILLPKKLMKNLNINAKSVAVSFHNSSIKNLKVNMKESLFRAKKIVNSNIKINNADFKVENIIGGEILLKNTSIGLIGEIENAKLITENSKVEIGKVKENVMLKDFNSKIYLYNFSNSFNEFNLTGEYSTIYFYEPDNDFEMMCVGNNGTFHFGHNNIVSVQPSKSGEKTKMIEKKRKNNKPFAGVVKFDIVHTNLYYPRNFLMKKK